MRLFHTAHDRHGRADIVANPGTDNECIVGQSQRTVKDGGPHYTINDSNGGPVYSGPSMREGLIALGQQLKGAGDT